ncbi:MAG: hypothetical protein IPJ40_13495 [Saprospirales bacterium]|nr:hypothetical protein [Saprospirales bacterium]
MKPLGVELPALDICPPKTVQHFFGIEVVKTLQQRVPELEGAEMVVKLRIAPGNLVVAPGSNAA